MIYYIIHLEFLAPGLFAMLILLSLVIKGLDDCIDKSFFAVL